MNDKYTCKYEYKRDIYDVPLHTWSVVGKPGGIHLHIRESGKPDHPYFGGLEVHYRQPPDYMKDKPPSQEHCWLLDAPCWHDGSSLQAEEIWIPLWRTMPNDHDRMLACLTQRWREAFEEELSMKEDKT